ncbi:aldehyde dehydrogenase family protein [Mycobacterium sp. 2YAF39]|uniref:aldehyde dehydrogenase family protein n=1 Tax=Mycobacterium sp. 2YAF39 TaxID=3233033 RepID=UPI003F965F3A
MTVLDALGPGGEYRTRKRELITDVSGAGVAEMTVVPPLYVARTLNTQRKTRPLPAEERESALARAVDMFLTKEIAGLDFAGYAGITSRVSGLPISVTLAGAHSVAEQVAAVGESLRPAQPAGAERDWRDVRGGGAVWARRGAVFAVHASGNAPGVHGLWPQALMLGYRVAVRPSRREPFTGQRLIAALRESGFRTADVSYLPTDYAGADEIIRAADLAMVYGGQDVVDKYANNPAVWVNGPGRAKILITAEQDWRDHLDLIVESICTFGGTACVNTTAVLYEGDAAPLAEAIAERLSSLVALPITDDRAQLPVMSTAAAHTVAQFLGDRAIGTTPLLGADRVVADFGDGTAALRPAVHLLAAPDPVRLNTELAFPCVWVSPWSREDGLEPLRRSLVINAITDDEQLIDELVDDPTIPNVYSGPHPTWHSAPHIPHDGFLADFLMCNKGFIRG